MNDLQKLPQTEPKDLLGRLTLPKDSILVQTVLLREMPVIHADISAGERLVFYVQKVLPYVWNVLVFYLPIPPIIREQIMENPKEKTSTGMGIAVILTAVAAVLKALSDGDPATVPDWTTAVSSVIGGLGLIFARFRQ